MPLKFAVEHKAVIGGLSSFEYFMALLKKESSSDTAGDEKVSQYLRATHPCDFDLENDDAVEILQFKYKNETKEIYRNVAHKLFTIKNGKIYIKQERLSDYHLYTTALDIYPFFASYLLEKSEDLVEQTHRINYLKAYTDETFRLHGNLEQKIPVLSDMHVHLWAALDFHYRIHDILSNPDGQRTAQNIHDNKYTFPEELSHLFQKPIRTKTFFLFFSLIESFLLYRFIEQSSDEKDQLIYRLFPKVVEFFEERINPDEVNRMLKEAIDRFSSIRTDLLFIEKYKNSSSSLDQTLLIEAWNHFHVGSTIYDPKLGDKTLLLFFVHKLNESESNSLNYRLLTLYFMMRNFTKTLIVQQHRRTGFGYFHSYSNNALKTGPNTTLGQLLKSLVHPRIPTNIEGRIVIDKNSKSVHKSLVSLHQEVNKLNKKTQSEIVHHVRYIYHFIKSVKPNEHIDARFANVRKKYKKEVKTLSELFTNPHWRYYSNKKNLPCHNSAEADDIIDLTKRYVAGIDTASTEVQVPPEVFSGVYGFFKTSILCSGKALEFDPCILGHDDINLQYTYHVGEEFRDIVSGLRAIYEAVIFLNLKDEDRLGHAVALAIDPLVFLNDRRKISLKKSEYFDNLVFMYHILNGRIGVPISIEVIKNRINQLAYELYQDSNYSIDDYIDAWLLRRNCPNEVLELYDALPSKLKETDENKAYTLKKAFRDHPEFFHSLKKDSFEKGFTRSALPDYFNQIDEAEEPTKRYLSAKNNANAYAIYWKYSTVKSVEKHHRDYYEEDAGFSPEIYEYLQDVIMEETIAKKDIVVEVLPTSNVLITSIGSFDNHPFLRLHPPVDIIPNRFGLRKRKIKIVVGTDDPGIQGTNLMMELYHIKHLVAKNYGKKTAEDYILELCKYADYLFKKQ